VPRAVSVGPQTAHTALLLAWWRWCGSGRGGWPIRA